MSKDKENLVIIDADSIIYILGSKLENLQLEPLGIIQLDEFLRDILISTNSKHYLGFVGGIGRNFRKDIAITKEYKGNRAKEKPEWFEFWKPVFIEHMIEVWKFQSCANIEADDACGIARTVYGDMYNKVTIASPDKDLFQIGNTWFYNYDKRITLYCEDTVAVAKFCQQLITGDSSDNIPGCDGAGKVTADKFAIDLMSQGLSFDESVQKTKEFYIDWYTNVLRTKEAVRQEKEYLAAYKVENGLNRFTSKTKDEALKLFTPDYSSILSVEQVEELFQEQYSLVKLLASEEEGKKHGFVIEPPIINTTIDWDSIEVFEMELDGITPPDERFEFEDML